MGQKKFNPLVSVILPTYNRANLIKDALNSIFAQTYKKYELIIVDDGSTDNTKDIIKDYLKMDKVKYIFQKNQGPGGAFTSGIKKSRGRFIAIHASDDLWLPVYLEILVSALKNSIEDIGMVYSNCFNYNMDSFDINLRYDNDQLKDGNLLSQFVFRKMHIYHGAAIIRKSCFKKVGYFDKKFKTGTDRDFNYRFSKHYKIKAIKKPLAIVRLHGKKNPKEKKTKTTQTEKIEYEKVMVNKILKDETLHGKYIFFRRRLLSRYNYIWGKGYNIRQNYKMAKLYLLRSLKYNIFNIKSLIYLLLSLLKLGDRKKQKYVQKIENPLK